MTGGPLAGLANRNQEVLPLAEVAVIGMYGSTTQLSLLRIQLSTMSCCSPAGRRVGGAPPARAG
jgi:hypothetical protein